MRRLATSIAVVIGVLVLAQPIPAAQSTAAALHVGAAFPTFTGQTITGLSVRLFGAVSNKPAVLVFSFSRAAGNDARKWSDRLATDFRCTISAYGIIQLESEPKIFRRLAVAGIKTSMPVSVQNRTIVLYRDEEAWKQQLAVTDASRAYVVAIDQAGTIRWVNSSSFSDASYRSLKNELETLLQQRP
ncbi:MAG: hypothetical protein ACYCOR_15760 [Acidobacteriaceae bacterium]